MLIKSRPTHSSMAWTGRLSVKLTHPSFPTYDPSPTRPTSLPTNSNKFPKSRQPARLEAQTRTLLSLVTPSSGSPSHRTPSKLLFYPPLNTIFDRWLFVTLYSHPNFLLHPPFFFSLLYYMLLIHPLDLFVKLTYKSGKSHRMG